MIKFSSGTNIDFLKLTNTSVKLERENNFKEYKSLYHLDQPKFGAGSEYGREQKEEARRKKYGINIKKYDPEAQPWLMKVGKGKDAKRFKGVREGTITENTSYYIFTQCADGAFEAFPIEEWYNFQPVVSYKYLNSEEAEEEFTRRDKTLNKFSIMVRKRIKNEGEEGEANDVADGESKSKSKGAKKKDKSLILTDMDEWGFGSEEDDDDDEEEGEEGVRKPKEKKKAKEVKRKKNSKLNDQDEAIEESDEGDFDDRELDYITDSGSESELDEKDKEEKYDDKGVDQEQGLKKLIDSEDESSEEEEKKDEDEEEPEEPEQAESQEKGKKKKKEKKEGGESDSSSSSSDDDDDSDIDKNEGKFSVLFMQKKSGSRSNTPTFDKSAEGKSEVKSEGLKRKIDADGGGDGAKKSRTDSPVPSAAAASHIVNTGEITEDTIRRYLMRKPMTAKELLHKFKSKKPQMSNDQMTQKIGQLLKKINPDRKYVNNILYLSIKKTG